MAKDISHSSLILISQIFSLINNGYETGGARAAALPGRNLVSPLTHLPQLGLKKKLSHAHEYIILRGIFKSL